MNTVTISIELPKDLLGIMDVPENLLSDKLREMMSKNYIPYFTESPEELEKQVAVAEELLNRDCFPPAESLSDAEVVELADLKMDTVQNKRLGELQSRGKVSGLTANEQFELLVLIHRYQIDQLRKSEGLAESVRRGLQKPLPS
ncbi:hypothetical protein QUF76_07435 [Desulfobacterales bacterium HSG16]|nr:hypothetical protein [Desulfobacterales bacterium HSG16]